MMRFHQFSLSVIASIATSDASSPTTSNETVSATTPPPSPISPLSPTSQSTLDKLRRQIEEDALSQTPQLKDYGYADNPKLQPVSPRQPFHYTTQLRSKLFATVSFSRTAQV
ncbi:hypothetical protein BDF19DRAFT_424036 [Syncephalis fuscata]|nr:hypothetical protein BDF19DRAFT_424036 [Syncephalis fuscata]